MTEIEILQQLVRELISAKDGVAALMTAEVEHMCKKKGERDTEFVKRIAGSYNSFAATHFEARLRARLSELSG